jgi:hypothetical protein
MASPNHAWWEGMYLVSRNFYGKFLPEVRQEAGPAAQAIIDRHLTDDAGHGWLSAPDQVNAILGFGTTYGPPGSQDGSEAVAPDPQPAGHSDSTGTEASSGG